MKNAAWQRDFRRAQTVKTYSIDSRECRRIPYGKEKEDWGADIRPCNDCGVSKGSLHLLGCDVEQCPICSGPVVSCECAYDDRPGSM